MTDTRSRTAGSSPTPGAGPNSRRAALPLAPVLLLLAVVAVSCGESDPVDPGNQKPHIQGLVANPTTLARGALTRLTALASDPDDDPVTYRWVAAAGAFSDSSGGTIRWRAPEASGVYTIRVVVSDGELSDSTAVNVTVGSGMIRVFSTPPGIAILLNGQATGKVTPDSLTPLAIDEYNVELANAYFRFAPAETTLSLSDGETATATFRVPPVATEVVNFGAQGFDEIGGLAYYPGGIGVLYSARIGSETSLRSTSLIPGAGGTSVILHEGVMLHEPLALRPRPGLPVQVALVSADRIQLGGLIDNGENGLVDQIDTLWTLGNVIGESYGPAFSRNGRMIGYAASESSPPNGTDILLAGRLDSTAVTGSRLVATNRRGNSLAFGTEPFAVFESSGELYITEIDSLTTFPAVLLTESGGDAFAPAVSPDGRHIAFLGADGSVRITAPGIDPAPPSERVTLTLLTGLGATRVAWAPGGNELLVADNRQPGNAKLLLVYNLPIR